MDLIDYFRILQKRYWVIGLTALVAVVVVVGGILFIPPIYRASATLRVVPPQRGSSEYLQLLYADRVTNTYIEMVRSSVITQKLQQSLGVEEIPEVGAQAIPDTDLLLVTAESRDPVMARRAANDLAEILIVNNPVRDVNIQVVELAQTPEPPDTADRVLQVGIALVVGLFAGVGLAFLTENLDRRVYSERQLRQLIEAPILGYIPYIPKEWRGVIAASNGPHVEAVRRLRTNLMPRIRQSQKVLLFSSGSPGDGKSTVVAYLAASMGAAGVKTIVVDIDPHRPAVHNLFGLSNTIGLGLVLSGQAELEEAIRDSGLENLHVLTSGPRLENWPELLASDRLSKVLQDLRNEYDLVLIDSPALLAVVDAAIVAPLVDGVVLVVEQGKVSERILSSVRAQIEATGAQLIGLVLNRVGRSQSYHQYYQYYHHKASAEHTALRQQDSPQEAGDSRSTRREEEAAPPLSEPGNGIPVAAEEDGRAINAAEVEIPAKIAARNPSARRRSRKL